MALVILKYFLFFVFRITVVLKVAEMGDGRLIVLQELRVLVTT